jgi:hypothetical protein
MNRILVQRLSLATCLIAACKLSSEPGSDPRTTIVPEGMIVGFVHDTTGRGIANAAICATALFDVSGTPFLLVTHSVTNTDGVFTVPIDWNVRADIRGGLTVAATPPVASGLAPGMQSRLTVLISATPPPAETTHVDLQVVEGTPYSGVFCAYGG